MKIKNKAVMLAILVWVSLYQSNAQTQATKASNFVNRIGVNTHFGYNDTNYVLRFDEVKQKLDALGVKYCRDGLYRNGNSRMREIKNDLNIKFQGVINNNDLATGSGYDVNKVTGQLNGVRDNMGTDLFIAVEGLNEPDIWGDNDPDWASTARAVQQQIYNTMKNDPAWNDVTVLGPSGAFGGTYSAFGDLTSMTDEGNMHWYPSDKEPSHQDFNYFDWHLNECKTKNYPDGSRLNLSETGYNNTPGGIDLPEGISAKYIPRAFMYFLYTHNMQKVFSYELLDLFDDPNEVESNWGLLRNDLTEKPAFVALKNTISLLSDNTANFSPGSLNYVLNGDKSNIKQKLFQKSNGRFYLVLWQEVRCFNPDNGQVINNPDRNLTLQFNQSVASVKVYEPIPAPAGKGLTPTNTYATPTSVSLSVPDHLMIVEIVPGGAPLGKTVWLRAESTDKYVSVNMNRSDRRLEASWATAIGSWERFRIEDAGDGKIALKPTVNSKYVAAEYPVDKNPLRGNRDAVQGWEKFTWINNSDGTISLLANATGKYVAAEQDNGLLHANRSAIGPWEKFTWGEVSNARFVDEDQTLVDQSEGYSVYPNPIIESLTVEAPVGTVIRISSLEGKLVYQSYMTENKLELPAEILPGQGIYIMEMQHDGKHQAVKKLYRQLD